MFGRPWLVLVAALAACHGGTTEPGPDAAAPGAGLSVRWVSEPATFPADLEDNLDVRDVTFTIGSLGVIGDAGAGDPRTTVENVEVKWSADSSPDVLMFPDAPSGQYTSVALDLDGHLITSSFSIHGHYNGLPFVISDRSPFSLSLQLDRTLQAGGGLAIGLRVKLHDAITAIDWQNVPLDDGTHYEIETGSSALQTFRQVLSNSIEIDDSIE